MLTNAAKAAGAPADSAIEASEDSQILQVESAPTQRQGTRLRKQTVRYGQETNASSGGDQDLRDDHNETPMEDRPVTTQQKRRTLICNFVDASNKDKLRALLTRPSEKLDSPPGSSNGNSKKRRSSLSNDSDVDGSEPARQSADNLPKRQRRQTAKERAEYRAAAANVQESFPEPRGQPEVWADVSRSPRNVVSLELTLLQGPPEPV